MKPLCLLFLFCISSCAMFTPHLKKIDSSILEKRIEKVRKKYDQPGMAAAVIQGDTITAYAAAGTIVYNTTDPVDVQTSRFHIGSTTKGITATLIAMLVEEGKLSRETTLKEIFPEMVMRKEYEEVTIHHLFTSTGGIVPMQDDEKEPWARTLFYDIPFHYTDPGEQRLALTKAALNLEPVVTVGKTFYYSNTGWGILGTIAEKVTGESFEVLMQKRVFDALGMTSAKIGGWPASPTEPYQPRGHYCRILNPYTKEYHFKEYKEPTPQALDDEYILPPWMNPAGGVHCTIKDFALFARDQLQGLQGKGTLLSGASYEKIHRVNKVTNMDNSEREIGYGFAFGYAYGGKHRISGGDGSGGTFYAKIIIYPGIDTAFVCFTNCGNGERSITELMMSLMAWG